MQNLIDKYKVRQERKEAKAFEEWKRTSSKSAIKIGLFLSFVWIAMFTLLRVWDIYRYNESYLFDNLKRDFAVILIFSLLGGVFVAWSINRNFQKRLDKERANNQKYNS